MKKTFALVSATTLIFATTSFAADIEKKEIAVTRSGGSSSARTLTFDSTSEESKDEINIEKSQARARLADSYKAEEDNKREVKLGRSGGSAAKLTHKFE